VQQTTERLPFTIRIVTSAGDIARAALFRSVAYGRHLPELAARLAEPDPCDLDGSAVVLLAEAKHDGATVGTARIQTNRRRQLDLERSVELPAPYRGSALAEPTRLGVIKDPIGPTVKIGLFKALYMYSLAQRLDWVVLAARAPLDRQYEAIGFTDVFSDRGYIAMAHAGGVPHRVLALRVASAEAMIAAAHPMATTLFLTHHPDISIAPPA
jgi:hypothetical protein